MSDADLRAVEAQLGRRPRDAVAVAHRCPCGNPDVVATAPRLSDGTPFPTLYYLTCPRASSEVGTLEAAGVMSQLTGRLGVDAELAAAYRDAHEAYLTDRGRYGAVPEIDNVSAGGMPDRVKCLHVLVAHTLAAGAGVNPLGDETVAMLPDWWAEGPCVAARRRSSLSKPGVSRHEELFVTDLPHPITRRPFPSPVPPGSGWPGDLAHCATPRADDADDVRRLAAATSGLDELDAAISVCRACPRLVAWRETVAVGKRKSLADQPYWGRPIMGWGSATPAVLIVGLAPAAHGGNRTGRIFTGDRSGDWLFGSLHRVGLAAQPTSEHAGDAQALIGTRLIAAVRCAPPDNKPTPIERDTCAPWLDAELSRVLPSVRVIVCLGSYAWDSTIRALARLTIDIPRPRTKFGHGAQFSVARRGAADLVVLGSYHPSQQNTFTGKLTEPMLDAVLGEAARLSRAEHLP